MSGSILVLYILENRYIKASIIIVIISIIILVKPAIMHSLFYFNLISFFYF